MSDHVAGLCGAIEELTVIYEEILGRSLVQKWAIVAMDMARLNRLVEEEEVLAGECRAVEKRRLEAAAECARALDDGAENAAPALADIVRRVPVPTMRERLARASERLRGVLAMLRRVVEANRQLIMGGLKHFERFYRVVQEASVPRTHTYSPQGTVAVRDPAAIERGLRFVDRQV